MCNGSSSRLSRGGSIAILHAPQTTTQRHHKPTSPSSSMRLFFRNNTSAPGTSVEIEGFGEETAGHERSSVNWVVIHQDGDLSNTSNHSKSLYSFALPTSSPVTQLEHTLELGVSEVGIIGRRVSVLEGVEGCMVAEGIIGWN